MCYDECCLCDISMNMERSMVGVSNWVICDIIDYLTAQNLNGSEIYQKINKTFKLCLLKRWRSCDSVCDCNRQSLLLAIRIPMCTCAIARISDKYVNNSPWFFNFCTDKCLWLRLCCHSHGNCNHSEQWFHVDRAKK